MYVHKGFVKLRPGAVMKVTGAARTRLQSGWPDVGEGLVRALQALEPAHRLS